MEDAADAADGRRRATSEPIGQPVGLPRDPGALRRLMRRHPWWVDGAIAVLYLLGTAALAVLGAIVPASLDGVPELETPGYLSYPQVLLLALVVATTVAALLLRRRLPLTSLVAVVAVSSFLPADMLPVAAASIAIWVLLYSVPVYRSPSAGWIGYGVTVAATLMALPLAQQADPDPVGMATFAVTTCLLMLIPLMLGVNAGNRRRYTDAIIDRAHQLARERDQLARLAVAEERSRIAREMHDIVAHSVSVMVTLSEGAARAAEVAPAEAARAMEQSAETGRAALAEMRRLLGALRDPEPEAGAELQPTPGAATLPELIEGFRAAGLTVELTFRGTARGADQGRELAVYRTVQEALTNTLRHAGPGAAATVEVDERPGATRVRVTDDGGAPGRSPLAGVGSGQGLLGLAERVRVFGGELDFGPAGRGWQVTATLPASAADGKATDE